MELPIDYLKFASFEGLTIDEIIYLLMEVEPNVLFKNRPPPIPKDCDGEIDPETDPIEWDNFYFRIRDPINNAIEVGSLTPVKADKFNPTEVGKYIYNVSVEKGWDNEFFKNPFIKALGIKQDDKVALLQEEIKSLQEQIARLDKRSKYSNTRLYWLDQIIDEYFVFDEVEPNKKTIINWLKSNSFSESEEGEKVALSSRVCNAIATIVISDKKRKGGAPKKTI